MGSDDDLRVDLQAPDIADWRHGNTGVDYAHCLDSGRPGPDALINALMHGNELCGAIAVDRLLRSGFCKNISEFTFGWHKGRARQVQAHDFH